MLTDARAVEAVVRRPRRAAGRPAARATCSSTSRPIAPDESRALAERVAAAGAAMLDAPVSGSLTTLAAGQLSIMVGGDRARLRRASSRLLLAIGPKVTYLGANGSALLMKLAINVSLVVQGMSFCESVAMAEKAGIAREAAVDAVLKSVIASPMLAYRGPMILEGGQPETAFANVDLQQKDQQLGLRARARARHAAAVRGAGRPVAHGVPVGGLRRGGVDRRVRGLPGHGRQRR